MLAHARRGRDDVQLCPAELSANSKRRADSSATGTGARSSVRSDDMIRKLILPAVAAALLGGCVSAGYGYRHGSGDGMPVAIFA